MKSNITIKDNRRTVLDINPTKKDVVLYNDSLFVVCDVLSADGVLAFDISKGDKVLLTYDMQIEIVDIEINILRRSK